MKKFSLIVTALSAFAAFAHAGDYSGRATKQVAPSPCPEWYGDTEWNVNLWGTYTFTNTDYNPNLWLVDIVQSTSEGGPVVGSYDKYVGGDHAWGGGVDLKYFFYRYFGVGLEGWIAKAHKTGFDIFESQSDEIFTRIKTRHDRAIGAILGTFTLRYPVPCTRFAPYAFAGGGVIFGGGESDTLITHGPADAFEVDAHTRHFDGETKALGHFGFGLETRITRHIGWTNDISWGVIDGPKNNFTMIRTGLNFAF